MSNVSEEQLLAGLEVIKDPEIKEMLQVFTKRGIVPKIVQLMNMVGWDEERVANIVLWVFEQTKKSGLTYDEAASKFEDSIDATIDKMRELEKILEQVIKPRVPPPLDPPKMMVVPARLKTQEIDGIKVTDKPVGTQYLIDLNSKEEVQWFNNEHKHGRKLIAVRVVDEDDGYLPFEMLEVTM